MEKNLENFLYEFCKIILNKENKLVFNCAKRLMNLDCNYFSKVMYLLSGYSIKSGKGGADYRLSAIEAKDSKTNLYNFTSGTYYKKYDEFELSDFFNFIEAQAKLRRLEFIVNEEFENLFDPNATLEDWILTYSRNTTFDTCFVEFEFEESEYVTIAMFNSIEIEDVIFYFKELSMHMNSKIYINNNEYIEDDNSEYFSEATRKYYKKKA